MRGNNKNFKGLNTSGRLFFWFTSSTPLQIQHVESYSNLAGGSGSRKYYKIKLKKSIYCDTPV